MSDHSMFAAVPVIMLNKPLLTLLCVNKILSGDWVYLFSSAGLFFVGTFVSTLEAREGSGSAKILVSDVTRRKENKKIKF